MLDLSSVGPTGQYLLSSSREYAIYVCATRAIPSIQDGLKHGQRVALWLLRNRADKIKTYALAGLLGYEKLYLHGEKSATDTIGLLAAPFRNNVPLIEGLGQFGSRVAPVDGIGAPRYTDVKRAKAAEAILYHDLDLVPLKSNYDGSNQEPVHFLPLIPTVLLNGISGVAVGWSTDILPRSLHTLIEATKDALQGKPIRELPPSFARYNVGVRPLGPNQWEFSGHVEILNSSAARITELPPGMAIETIRKRLIALEESDSILSFADRSTDAIDITVKFRRGSLNETLANGSVKVTTQADLIELFKLRERHTERIVVVSWSGDAIHTYTSAQDVVKDFAQWRLQWYTKRYEKRRSDSHYELTYWKALQALFLKNFPSKLGKSQHRSEMEQEVVSILTKAKVTMPDETQLDRIMMLPTFRWTAEFKTTVDENVQELEAAIAEHETILASPERLLQAYLKDLQTLKGAKL